MPWLIVVGEREGLRWIVKNSRMAFRDTVKGEPSRGDQFVLYISRGAFHNPTRDEAQILACGSFVTGIENAQAVVHGERYSRTAQLRLEKVLKERNGLPFKPLIDSLEFIKKKDAWAPYMRRTLIPLVDRDFSLIRSSFLAFPATS